MKILWLLLVVSLPIQYTYGQPTLEELITHMRTQVKAIKYDGEVFTMETVEKWKGAPVGLTQPTILEFNSSESGRLAIDFCKVTCASVQVYRRPDSVGSLVISFTGNEAIERYGKTYKNGELILNQYLSTDTYKTSTENLILLLKYFCCN